VCIVCGDGGREEEGGGFAKFVPSTQPSMGIMGIGQQKKTGRDGQWPTCHVSQGRERGGVHDGRAAGVVKGVGVGTIGATLLPAVIHPRVGEPNWAHRAWEKGSESGAWKLNTAIQETTEKGQASAVRTIQQADVVPRPVR
jgi:hypothetical protein